MSIGLLLLTILPLFVFNYLQTDILDSVRAYVTGEAQWSKNQKDATHALEHYARTHDESAYKAFLQHMAVPLGDKRARLALQSHPPQLEQAAEGFLAGKNHPDDIDRLIGLFLNFSGTELMDEAITIWTEGDVLIEELLKIGAELHNEIGSGAQDQGAIEKHLHELHVLHNRLHDTENRFSASLGEVARSIHRYAEVVAIFSAIALFLIGTFLTRKIMFGIRKAHEKIILSEHELRQAQKIGHIGSFSLEQDKMSCSPQGYRILGVSPDAFEPSVGSLIKLVHSDDRFVVREWIEAARNATAQEPVAFRIVHSDGSVRNLLAECEWVCDDKDIFSHLSGTFQDVTERKFLEAQAQESQKMEALGTLVGGIAHDFNNILAGMTGNLYLAKIKSKDNPEVIKKLEVIEGLSFRTAKLIRQLLSFAHKERTNTKPLEFTSFVEKTIRSTYDLLAENIELQEVLSDELLTVNGDSEQLQQVITNIMKNARDAVEEVKKPAITIKLDKFLAGNDFTKIHPDCKEGLYAHLSVEDNGCGILEEDLSHLYEPFFTTKEQGKGTGLGLSMVLGAIQTHFGAIDVESCVDKGSTFHIYLPLIDEGESQPS